LEVGPGASLSVSRPAEEALAWSAAEHTARRDLAQRYRQDLQLLEKASSVGPTGSSSMVMLLVAATGQGNGWRRSALRAIDGHPVGGHPVGGHPVRLVDAPRRSWTIAEPLVDDELASGSRAEACKGGVSGGRLQGGFEESERTSCLAIVRPLPLTRFGGWTGLGLNLPGAPLIRCLLDGGGMMDED
jgi:hypothetical protein